MYGEKADMRLVFGEGIRGDFNAIIVTEQAMVGNIEDDAAIDMKMFSSRERDGGELERLWTAAGHNGRLVFLRRIELRVLVCCK